MAWAAVGVTVSVTAAGGVGTQFVGAGTPNTGAQVAYVSRVFNNTGTVQRFSLGASNHTPKAIALGPNAAMFIAHGPTDNFIIADATTVQICPGVGNITAGS